MPEHPTLTARQERDLSPRIDLRFGLIQRAAVAPIRASTRAHPSALAERSLSLRRLWSRRLFHRPVSTAALPMLVLRAPSSVPRIVFTDEPRRSPTSTCVRLAPMRAAGMAAANASSCGGRRTWPLGMVSNTSVPYARAGLGAVGIWDIPQPDGGTSCSHGHSEWSPDLHSTDCREPMNTQPPAGWYPDPDNRSQQRYWDGNAWTEQRGPAQSVQPPHPSGPPPPQWQSQQGGATSIAGVSPQQKSWFARHKVLTAVLALILIAGIASAMGGGGDDPATTATDNSSEKADPSADDKAEDEPSPKEPEPTEEPESEAPEEPEALSVDAKQILKDFDGNEAAADAKYEGQTLRVTGEVVKVDTEFFDEDEYVVQVGSGAQFEFLTVNCNDLSSEEVIDLSKGDDITVMGDFDDGGDLGVEIKDCAVA